MLIIFLIIGTLLFMIWILLLFSIQLSDFHASAYHTIVINHKKIEQLQLKEEKNEEILENYYGLAYRCMCLRYKTDYSKEISKLEELEKQMKKSNFRGVSIFPLCGHVILRKFPHIRSGAFYRKMLADFMELYGRKHAAKLTDHLLATMSSCMLLGTGISIFLGTIKIAQGENGVGLVIMLGGCAFTMLLAYAFCDEVTHAVHLKRKVLLRQFPNVVSKLALLVSAGMIMDKAWKETAYSGDTGLYIEMKKTSQELENLIQPEVAYGGFVTRCHTKETSKLASAIMQNLSKGNSEIGIVLREMAADAWQERRHLAKRDSEDANAKMMIPTLLLFATILFLMMVPIALNFSVF